MFFQELRSRPLSEFSKKAFYKDGRLRETTFVVESLLRSQCFDRGQVQCGHCHDPHPEAAAGNPKSLKFPNEPNQMCLQCHEGMAADMAFHTRHPADSNAGACTACHMPAIMNSLLFKAGTHKIDDIPDAERTSRFGHEESPNACLLCHQDRDTGWLTASLRAWKKPETPHTDTLPAGAPKKTMDSLNRLVARIDAATAGDRFTLLVEAQARISNLIQTSRPSGGLERLYS